MVIFPVKDSPRYFKNAIDNLECFVIKYIKKGAGRLITGLGEDMERYERLIGLYGRVYSKPSRVKTLKIAGAISVAYVAAVFCSLLLSLVFEKAYVECARLALMAAIPFSLVSLMRHLLDVPRPYEVIAFPPLAAMRGERKAGKSCPSRHVFSAFLIGALALYYSPILGILTLFIGAFVALERVMLGIHFVRDVIVGAVIGVLSGVIGILFL